jgi:hypothetical protein
MVGMWHGANAPAHRCPSIVLSNTSSRSRAAEFWDERIRERSVPTAWRRWRMWSSIGGSHPRVYQRAPAETKVAAVAWSSRRGPGRRLCGMLRGDTRHGSGLRNEGRFATPPPVIVGESRTGDIHPIPRREVSLRAITDRARAPVPSHLSNIEAAKTTSTRRS